MQYLEELEPYLDKFPKYVVKGDKLISCSPFRDDSKPSFAVNLLNGTWIDSGAVDDRYQKGNFITLIIYFTGETYEEAFNRLNEGHYIDIDTITLTVNLKPLNSPLNAFYGGYSESSYLTARAIPVDVQQKYCTSQSDTAVSFPVYFKGNLINVKNRKLDSKVFWYQEKLNINDYLYGIDNTKTGDTVYVVEGETDCLSVATAGLYGVGTFGANVSEKQIQLLKARYSRTVIVPDNDKVGVVSAKKLAKQLYPLDAYICELPSTVKDVNEFLIKYGSTETRSYLTDNLTKWRFRDG